MIQHLTTSPGDGATMRFGMQPAAPTATAGQRKIYIRRNGYLRAVEVYSYAGTAGSGEAWSLYVQKNGDTTGTSLLVQSVASATNQRIWTNTTMGGGVPLAAGDYLEMRFVNPSFGTNPATFITGGYLYLNTTEGP
jgi:hypothetical protein